MDQLNQLGRRSLFAIIAGIATLTGPYVNAGNPAWQCKGGACVRCEVAMKLVAEKDTRQLEQLVNQRDPCAEHFLALMYLDGSGGLDVDRAKALELEKRAAESGFDVAQYSLGLMYLGTPKIAPNYPEAVRWFRNAADQGDVSSQIKLGKMLIEGRHVKKDIVEGRKWLLKAAEHGDTEARELLDKLAKSPEGKSVPPQR